MDGHISQTSASIPPQGCRQAVLGARRSEDHTAVLSGTEDTLLQESGLCQGPCLHHGSLGMGGVPMKGVLEAQA